MISSINLLNRSYGDFVLSGERYPFETIQLLFSKNQSHIHIIARQGREIPEGVLNLTIYAEQTHYPYQIKRIRDFIWNIIERSAYQNPPK